MNQKPPNKDETIGGLTTMMRAVQVTRAKGPFELVEREIPQPAAGQVRIKVEACGVCHSDAMTKEGLWPPGIQYPRVPGHEIAGVIDAIGTGVAGWTSVNASAWAGTAAIADTVTLAAAATSLPVKSRCKFPASPTTAATPNT